jgi:hypothetical protein
MEVPIFEAYFDASGLTKPASVLSAAGYLLTTANRRNLDTQWTNLLAPYFGSLPPHKRTFRMAAFNDHQDQPYCDMSTAQRDLLFTQLSESAALHVAAAVCASVNRSAFDSASDASRKTLDNPYTMACLWCMEQFANYLKEFQSPADTIQFFFEAGDVGQDRLQAFVDDQIATKPKLGEKYRFQSFKILPKDSSHAFAAADVLAWHYRRAVQQLIDNKPIDDERQFITRFVNPPIAQVYYGPNNIAAQTLVTEFMKRGV